MTPEETRAENGRLEEELRQAHAEISRLRSELASVRNGRAHDTTRSEAAKDRVGAAPPLSPDTEEIELEVPGVLRVHLRGRAALRFCGLEVPRCEDQGDGG